MLSFADDERWNGMCRLWTILLLATPQDPIVIKLLREGDLRYEKRAEAGEALKAEAAYKKALALDSASDEACWKLARVLYWMGSHEIDSGKKLAIHKDGIAFAKLALAANAESVPAHFWLGVHYGLFGEAKGVGQSLYLADFIKKEMEWVIKKDEGFMAGAAYRILGRLYFRLPGIEGGDYEKAIELLKKSLTFKPCNPMSRTFLADVYIAQGKKAEAVKELESVLLDPIDPEYEAEFKEEHEAARKRLRELAP
jgi:tetratricopeptide (TPR) repeat protein